MHGLACLPDEIWQCNTEDDHGDADNQQKEDEGNDGDDRAAAEIFEEVHVCSLLRRCGAERARSAPSIKTRSTHRGPWPGDVPGSEVVSGESDGRDHAG